MTALPHGNGDSAEQRMRINCDGTPVFIECPDGRWVVADEQALRAEQELLAGLGGQGNAVDRALAICGALNACLIYPDEARLLNRDLAQLESRRPRHFCGTDWEWRIAITQACAWLSTEGAWRWLLWMLPKRLEPSLRSTPWIVPGWHGWDRHGMYWEFNGNFARWLDDEFWDRMEGHPDERFQRLAVVTDPKAAPEHLRPRSNKEPVEICDLIAVHPSTDPDVLSEMWVSWKPIRRQPNRVLARTIQNRNSPIEVLAPAVADLLAGAESGVDFALGLWAISHPNVPARLLTRVEREFAAKGDHRIVIRRSLARHRKASPRLLRRLARDASHEVRAAVAGHGKAPVDLLSELSADRRREVRRAVASHSAAPSEALERLASDAVQQVRFAAARNPATPQPVLDALTQDDDFFVMAAAAANPSTATPAADAAHLRWIDRVSELSRHEQFALCWRSDASPDLLRRLAAIPDMWPRIYAAEHEGTPVDVFESLVDEALASDDQVLLDILIANPRLPRAERHRVMPALRATQERPPRRMTAEARRLEEARRRARRAKAASAKGCDPAT